MAPAPNRYHQDISRNLEFILLSYLKKHPIGKIYHAPFDVYIDEHNVFQPDIIFVSKERFSILTEAGVDGAPDLVVEILSPKTAKLDRENKRKIYARSGVQELWIISPDTQRVEIFRLPENAEKPVEIWGQDEVFTSPLLPGLRIGTAEIFLA